MITTEKPPVGGNIRRLRETQGLGTADLAREAGTLQRNVQRWERGEVVPSWPLMVRVSEALDVEPYMLWVQA